MNFANAAMDVLYCEGWDASGFAAMHPISPSEARARDRLGEQYAALLTADGSPAVLIEVAWNSNSCAVWRFDTHKRRAIMRDLRLTDGNQLVIVEEILWAYSDERQNEFDESAATRTSRIQGGTTRPGMMVMTNHARTSMPIAPDFHGPQRPEFGDWSPLVREEGRSLNDAAHITHSALSGDRLIEILNASVSGDGYWRPIPFFAGQPSTWQLVERYPAPPNISVSTNTSRSTWRPPRPLQPDPKFLTIPQGTKKVSVRRQERLLKSLTIGRLRLPTGHLIVCDPYDYFLTERRPYTVGLPPGEYPLVINVADSLKGPNRRVAAGGLIIREEKVTSWELSLLPGEDVRLLPDGATYGFGVDSGMVCFFDASFLPMMTEAFTEDDDPLVDLGVPGMRVSHFGDSPEGASLIAFDSGWGDGRYPVWIGRNADGVVACIVADMQLDG